MHLPKKKFNGMDVCFENWIRSRTNQKAFRSVKMGDFLLQGSHVLTLKKVKTKIYFFVL